VNLVVNENENDSHSIFPTDTSDHREQATPKGEQGLTPIDELHLKKI